MRIFIAVALLFAASPAVLAAPITYTFTGTASGVIGGTTFSNAALTVTTTGDTSAISNPVAGTFVSNSGAGMTSFTIGGVGSGTFTDPTYVFDNQTFFGGTVGFGDVSDDIQIHGSIIGSTAYATYDLKSPIGALSPEPTDLSVADWAGLGTSLGSFTLRAYSDITFQASENSVPEPGTLSLLGLGLAAVGFMRRRQTA